MIPIDGQPILTAQAMRDAEAACGATTEALMARAGAAVAEQVRRLAMGAQVLVLCGPGNNGGDGYVAAAILQRAGVPVRVAATGAPVTEAAIAARAGWDGAVETLSAAQPAPVLIDALFGTGLSRPLDDAVGADLARLHAEARLSIAVDLPSGVATDDGTCPSAIPTFDLALALGALKPAHLLYPAAGHARAVRILDIGAAAFSDVAVLDRPILRTPGPADHKFTRGMVAVVAGRMPGAAALAATAAAHSGAGYVLLLGSATDRLPHAIVRRRYTADALDDLRIGALLIGPGLGRDDVAREKLGHALASPHPLVLDGDALHALDLESLASRAAPTVLTPHAGEFAALFGTVDGGKIARARDAARRSGATIVYKGADTVIAHPDGRVRVAHRPATWLSTAGTGDTLAGLAAGLLAGGHDPFAAACAAVWLHAEAARRCGPAFLADDLAAALPGAIAQCL
ncbi:NAD(P)H-hydrate dehydratase [Sphingomonas sp.]|uniref:NAD(P)H-hydrate dehydratase n=1 Tax=Sphingomonas sp. TaxID=28214 RepID=UPI0035BC5241